jgi:ABC-2 type transport system permease protein
VFRDVRLVFTRSITQVLRNPVWVVVNLVQPFFYLLFFAPLLKRTIGSDRLDGVSAYDIFVPGLLMQLALFGTAFAGFGLVSELREGVIERMLVTPVRRSALLIGRVLTNLVALTFQATVITLISWPMGLNLRPSAILGILVLLGVGVTCASLSYTVAMILGNEDALAGLLNFVTVPILLLSGMLLPLSLGPKWLQQVANINPLKHAVDAARDLFAGNLTTSAVGRGVGVVAICATAALVIGTRKFEHYAD